MSFANAATSDYLNGRKPTITCDCSEVVAQRYPLTMATADLALNNVGVIGLLPAGCVPVGVLVDSDDLDTGGSPALVWSIGLANTGETDISTAPADGGAAWGTGLTVSQAGGQVQVLSKAISRVTATQADRKIMLKATTAAATAAAGELGVTLLYRQV